MYQVSCLYCLRFSSYIRVISSHNISYSCDVELRRQQGAGGGGGGGGGRGGGGGGGVTRRGGWNMVKMESANTYFWFWQLFD